MRIPRIALLLVALLAACASQPAAPPDPIAVTFSSSQPEYAVGEQITFDAVYTNTTAEELTITHTLRAEGLMQQTMQRVGPGEPVDAFPEALISKMAGSVPVTFTVETSDLTPPFKVTRVVTVTVR